MLWTGALSKIPLLNVKIRFFNIHPEDLVVDRTFATLIFITPLSSKIRSFDILKEYSQKGNLMIGRVKTTFNFAFELITSESFMPTTNWKRLLKLWRYILRQTWLICPETVSAARKRHFWRSKSKLAAKNCLRDLPTRIIISSNCQLQFFFQRIKRKGLLCLKGFENLLNIACRLFFPCIWWIAHLPLTTSMRFLC